MYRITDLLSGWVGLPNKVGLGFRTDFSISPSLYQSLKKSGRIRLIQSGQVKIRSLFLSIIKLFSTKKSIIKLHGSEDLFIELNYTISHSFALI